VADRIVDLLARGLTVDWRAGRDPMPARLGLAEVTSLEREGRAGR
jgi:hypothetical protein